MTDSDLPEVSRRFEVPQSALSLLQAAAAASAQVAEEQSNAVARAAKLLDDTARGKGIVWVCGDAADEHQRRLEAAGHSAVCIVDPSRLPRHVQSGDLFFIAAVDEAPTRLIHEARALQASTILLCANSTSANDTTSTEVADAVIAVDTNNGQVIELAHAFVTMALCSQIADWEQSANGESAA